MNKRLLLGLLLAPVLFGQFGPPSAPVISDPSSLTQAIEQVSTVWFTSISPFAFEIFWALAGLEMAFLGWTLWRTWNGQDIRSVIFTATNKILMIGMFLALLMNAGTWMGAIINSFVQIGKAASGVPSIAPSVVLLQGFKIFGKLLWEAFKHGLMADIATAHALVFAGTVIIACFLVITIQFIIAKVQTFVALGAGVLFLGFGGSGYTSSYVERYFAYSFGAGIRLMMMYLLIGAGWMMTNSWIAAAQAIPFTQAGVQASYLIAAGAVLYASVCWFLPSHIAGLLGGSPNLSHSDMLSFVAPAIGAAVSGAMVAAGFASGGATAAVGGAVSGAASAANSVNGVAPGGSPSGGNETPQVSPGGGRSAASGAMARGAVSMAQVAVNSAARMPHSGAGGSTPRFNGFNH
jgi:type IV secretion system protein TrbL